MRYSLLAFLVFAPSLIGFIIAVYTSRYTPFESTNERMRKLLEEEDADNPDF